MTNDTKTDDIERVSGVQYTTTYGDKLRVVFRHRASTEDIDKVEEITGCSGELGATQEHLVSAEYPIRCLETDTEQ